jgi:hypothetical protein
MKTFLRFVRYWLTYLVVGSLSLQAVGLMLAAILPPPARRTSFDRLLEEIKADGRPVISDQFAGSLAGDSAARQLGENAKTAPPELIQKLLSEALQKRGYADAESKKAIVFSTEFVEGFHATAHE